MPTVANSLAAEQPELPAVITIGIDPHKSALTAVALDPTGHQLGARRFTVNAGTLRALLPWTAGWSRRRFAVEGAHGLGRGISQQRRHTGDGPAPECVPNSR